MTTRRPLPSRRKFSHATLTELVPSTGGSRCRVCGELIVHGELVHHRGWGVESAHERCGWFRPGEGLEPRETRTGGSFRTFLEWRCPSCELDATHEGDGPPPEDRRCRRCTRPVVGERAVLRRAARMGAHELAAGVGGVVKMVDDQGMALVLLDREVEIVTPLGVRRFAALKFGAELLVRPP